MGHSVLECPECGRYIMEGHHTWECDCGWKFDYWASIRAEQERSKNDVKK